ncbi:protein kinase domain-containing protein [Micromonospora sp. L31]|uniref:serine/threonine-protein kinase n=1 Tax=Micromonospora sp. L31 TaxID=3452213 RepID=UPI003F8C536A
MTEAAAADDVRVIAGRYRLDRPIGQGGMGEVWAGYDTRLDRRIAVKLMKQPTGPAASDPEATETARQRFLREVRTTAGLNHIGIPAVHDTGDDEESGELYLVMQLLRGAELHDLIGECDYSETPPSLAWVAAIGAQITAVLTEVHQLSVVHRDIKPRNIFLTPGGVVKVLDFGIAALLGACDTTRLTRVGHTVGTPPYMSPEQVLSGPIGPASDLYSLGCVLHEMLTGRPPFLDTDEYSVPYQQVHTPPPSVRLLRPDVPAPVEELIRALLHKQPERRPSSDEVYERLLPYASTDHLAGAGRTRDELDPTRPFLRPMAATPRGAPALALVASATTRPDFLSTDEADAAMERASDLANQEQFTQAADVLEAAIGRADEADPLHAELQLSLAHLLLIAESFHRAVVLFDAAGAQLAEHYGSDDEAVLACRYYATTCRAAAGEDSRALADFRAFLVDWTEHAGDQDDRSIDARRQIGGLLISLGRYQEARRELVDLHGDIVRWHGSSAPAAALVAAVLDRIDRYET